VRLENKIALVTGAGRGIGKAIAIRFAEEGADLAVTSRTREQVEAVAKKIEGLGRRSLALVTDVSDSTQVGASVEEVLREFDRIDILLNNAGVLIRGSFLDQTEQQWDQVIDVNLKGMFLCSQMVAREMIRQSTEGRIINMGSIESHVVVPGHVPYTASKGAILMLTKAMALELAPYRITVNAIGPGTTETEMNRDAREDPVRSQQLMAKVPLGRFGKPVDVANAALFLASEESRQITGTITYVDGGWLAA
jgi:NAD(P)-dependent dehydrogenase (short-subunit alcohol dehydrogenase family)